MSKHSRLIRRLPPVSELPSNYLQDLWQIDGIDPALQLVCASSAPTEPDLFVKSVSQAVKAHYDMTVSRIILQ